MDSNCNKNEKIGKHRCLSYAELFENTFCLSNPRMARANVFLTKSRGECGKIDIFVFATSKDFSKKYLVY